MKSKAIGITVAWILAALLFNAGIFFGQGQQRALEFFTGYTIEFFLSVDNLVVFFLIFSYFKISPDQQVRALTWGVWGAVAMRAVFILAGVALLKSLSWMVYAFGLLLVISGFKLFFESEKSFKFNKFLPSGLTSFWLVVIVVEAADLIFAVDSVPAVLAVTKDPFIVYSSNIFAILGLRSLYFVLSGVISRLKYLHYGLGIILVFVGLKMFLEPFWHMPIGYALGFIMLVLAIFAAISFKKNPGELL